MLISELLPINEGFHTGKPGREPRDYRGKIQYRHWLSKKPGKDLPDDVKELIKDYVHSRDGKPYLPEYDDDFYYRNRIVFKHILDKIRQYFDIHSTR